MNTGSLRYADAHIHLFRRGISGGKEDGAELLAYRGYRERFGIGPALVIGYEGQERFRGNNSYLRGLAARYPWVVPLRYHGAGKPIPRVLESEFAGFSIYLDDWVLREGSATLLQEVALASGVTPLISINGTPDSFAHAGKSLLGFDHSRILVSHLGLPGVPASASEEALLRVRPILDLAQSLELYVKISGLYAVDSDPDGSGALAYADVFRRELGAERLLWGSDYAPALDHQTPEVAFGLAAGIATLFSDAEQQMVRSGNLLNLLGR